MKKVKTIIAFLAFALLLGMGPKNVAAAEIVREGSKIVEDNYSKERLYTFKYDGSSAYYAQIYVSLSKYGPDNLKKDKIVFGLCDGNEKIVWAGKCQTEQGGYIFTEPGDLVPGRKYFFYAEYYGKNRNEIKVDFRVQRYPGFATSIKLPEKATVKTGESTWLKIKVAPANAFVVANWKSANTAIAEVDNLGYITGKKPGITYVTADINGVVKRCKVTVQNPEPYLNYSNYELYTGEQAALKLMYISGTPRWSSSNTSVATVSSKGKITAKKVGTCTITAAYKKKSYKCTITVLMHYPNFGATLYDYDTRENRFKVKICNRGSRSLTILASGARAEERHYKSFDRNLYMKNNVTIKPGKTVYLYFYVKGSVTWYDEEHFRLVYKFSYDGKTYEAEVWDAFAWTEPSNYKNGKDWYHTYWSSYSKWYESWYSTYTG